MAEIRSVVRAMRNGQLGGNGVISKRVQKRLSEITGAKHVLLAPNASQAMEIALLAMGIGHGDEVLLPSFSFPSQAGAILARGARPVFCEIDPSTLNMDPEDVEARITSRTRLIIPVHYAGVACNMDAIGSLARKHGILIVEDAAQGIAAYWKGKHLGTLGDAGFLSFHETKNIVCGEGGALLTNDEELFRSAEIIQEKGTNRGAFLRGEIDKYNWIGPGGNYVLSDLLAALLEAQLERIDELTNSRLRAWNYYHDALAELEDTGLVSRPVVPEHCEHNAHAYVLRTRTPALRQLLLDGMAKKGTEATFHFQPLHTSPFGRNGSQITRVKLPCTELAAETLVRLPLYSGMRRREVHRVVSVIRTIFHEYKSEGR